MLTCVLIAFIVCLHQFQGHEGGMRLRSAGRGSFQYRFFETIREANRHQANAKRLGRAAAEFRAWVKMSATLFLPTTLANLTQL